MKLTKAQAATLALTSLPAFFAGQATAPGEYVNDVIAEQATKVEYVQVLEGGRLPADAKETLTARVPDNVIINTHSGPEGDGYSIITKEKDKTVSIGVGAYAEEYTWIEMTPDLTATNTKPK